MANLMNERIRFGHLRLALSALGVTFAAPAAPAPQATTLSSPHCNAVEYRQLDFWIGDWETFEADTPDGSPVASARVESIAQGCAIHELYEQADGLVGDSILSHDPVRKQWQQTWLTNRGSIMLLWGNFRDGALVLEGEVHLQDGRTVMQRITWKEQDDGVRESAHMSKDGGRTWAPAFDVLFRKSRGQRVNVSQPRPSRALPPMPLRAVV